MTKGNYRVLRTISYPDFPKSKLELDVHVKANHNSEWATKMTINGTYDGPTDVVSKEKYQLVWTMEGDKILESGSAILKLSSGKSIRSVWKSKIIAEKGFKKFPSAGELINVSISPFQIEKNSMSYKWEGTVKKRSQ